MFPGLLCPAYRRRRGPVRGQVAAAAVLACFVLAACGDSDHPSVAGAPVVSEQADDSSTDGPQPAGGSARPCTGAATATADATVAPVAHDTAPALPVTYTDVRGKQVLIDSADRVLALDVAGTLASTVYALGLGDRLIGRDVSTGIPELRDLPVVTHNGHELNAEAILDIDPDLVVTDYSIGPLEVQLQLEESGIPVVITSSERNRSTIAPQIREVAKIFGVPQLGDQLAERVESDVAAAHGTARRSSAGGTGSSPISGPHTSASSSTGAITARPTAG